MKKVYVFLSIILAGFITNVNAQIAAWDFNGNLGSEVTVAATTLNANLAATSVSRGAGLNVSALANVYGATDFTLNGTFTDAVTNGDYIQFIIAANATYKTSLSTLDANFRRSSTGPNTFQWQYSLDGFATAGVNIGAAISFTNTATAGIAQTQIDLSVFPALQDVTNPAVITFRLYGYGATNIGGTFALGRPTTPLNDLALGGTVVVASGTPLITVTPATLTGFQALSGVPSAEQAYSITGSDLTNDIIVTPPVGFEIATVTGGPYTVNPGFITLPQTAGVVGPLNIYVIMNSATLGPNAGVVSNTSTGATTKNVALSGNVLEVEPTVQSAITFGAITNSTIQVNFTGGDGAHRILVAKALTAVNSDPADGTTYTGNSVFGAGSNLGAGNFAVYTGDLNTVLVSGLTAGTTYHFAVYEYNDGAVAGAENYLLPGGIGNETTIDVPVTYTWIGGSSTWNTAINWAPARLFPATNDILLFLDGTTETVTAVPNESIGQLHVTLGTNVTLQAAVTATALTINGTIALDDLTVDATSALNIDGANDYIINLATGTTGLIDGDMTFTNGAHKLTAVDASAVTFTNGSTFRTGIGFTSNPFGTASLNSIIFNNGSVMEYYTGSNPFGAAQPNSVVVFQAGSLYKVVGPGYSPAFSGRTYANVEFAGTGTSSMTGGSAVSIDNLTVTSGVVNIGMTGTPGHAIKRNISVAAGAELNFAPAAAGTINLNGTVLQTISNLGILTSGVNQTLNVDNAAGVTLNAPVTISGTLNFTTGIVKTTQTNLLTMAAGSSVTGASNGSYVDGPVRKIGMTGFTFPVGKTGFGYVPIGISNFAGGAATDQFVAEYMRGNARLLGPVGALSLLDHVSGCDYWTLNNTNGTPTVDVTCYWSANNTCFGTYIDNLADLAIGHFDGAEWNNSSVGLNPAPNGTIVAGDITWPGVTTFSPFSLASSSVDNPLPITINYFNGIKQNNTHVLNWKVTCSSTPFANIEMERSIDGRNYSSIYSIYATALRCQQPFDYTDASPVAGVNYYRLKMTDANGKITYSSVVNLLNASKGIDILNIAPNPIVGGSFELRVSAAKAAPMDIIITDMQGRLMQKRTVSMIAGFNAIPVNVRQFAAGTYQVYGTTADGRSKLLRFVVQ
mgnify:CR=1 FL=1